MAECQFIRRMPAMVRNLVRLYGRRTDSDVALGSAWYPKARRIVDEWSEHYGYHPETVAAVIAAISPQCSWERNLIIADDILADRIPSIGALKSNVDKARRIISEPCPFTTLGDRMRHYFPGGPKVYSFAHNLVGCDDTVTVDTHALQAALADVEATYTLKWLPYSVFATCYVNAADKVGIPPATFQAILWHSWKRLYPRALKNHVRKQWYVCGELE